MRRSVLAAGVMACAAAGPAAAQAPQALTFALTTCLQSVGNFDGARKAFAKAGYGYELEDYGNGPGGQIHWYAAPGGAVTVGVVVDRAGGSCRITAGGLTVGQVAPFARQGAEKLLGVSFAPGSPDGAANPACSSWARVGGRNVQVETASAGDDPMCLAQKPAQIMINVSK